MSEDVSDFVRQLLVYPTGISRDPFAASSRIHDRSRRTCCIAVVQSCAAVILTTAGYGEYCLLLSTCLSEQRSAVRPESEDFVKYIITIPS
jgi:hypothetical protein